MTRGLAVVGLGALAVAAAAAPLLVYSVSLAAFGLAHVAMELRYVEARFGPRMSGPLIRALIVLLAGVVALRLVRLAGRLELFGVDGELRVQAELILVALATVVVTRDVGLRAGVPSAVAVGLGAAIAAGAVAAPIPTILLLAVAHNWTPVGFVAEAGGAARWAGVGLVGFVLLPVVLAAGVVQVWLGPGLHELSVLATGPLEDHLGAFLPRGWHAQPLAVPLFSAVAFAQCVHYAAVLGVMPSLAPTAPVGPLTAIPLRAYLAAIALGTVVFVAGAAVDFGTARNVYSVVAAVHAWVELPVLILALSPRSAAAGLVAAP